ncbi:hypothetical protein [Acidiphilium sp. JA12-A1]|uniref:hypothetical protein n=1 Tax=Acidiphilium sp. JA12-A1 TaxID=1464546 RepID=UPI00128ED554|nr:hypothetical protein [Acidiphilium sp. JA12-A1]
MTDGELRGIVLQKFYDLRHRDDRVIQLTTIAESIPDQTETRIANICEQLHQHGLIDWRPLNAIGGYRGGMGNITANGVDVIEGIQSSPISIQLHAVSVHNSNHVQIGNANIQNATVDIEKLISAVNNSTASDQEKAAAKSLLQSMIQNPLVQWAWKKAFGPSP